MKAGEIRPGWDFDYAPIPQGGGDNGEPEQDLIIASADDLDPALVAELVGRMVPGVTVTPLFSSHPVFWTRVEASAPIDRSDLEQRLTTAGTVVRYIASARRGSQRLPPPLDLGHARQRRPSDWRTRPATNGSEPETPWRWFLRERGIDVVRACCGSGVGTRLAVIDNEGADLDRIGLDAQVLIGVDTVPRTHSHAALMLAWAVGTADGDRSLFRGVAPDASPRFYCIPKPGREVWALPLAIIRATEDGADVIVCATYVEGATSPLLDDALEFATRLGRGGRGTPVVLPTGREMSSPPGSTHSSLSLGVADPGSDPRVFCIGPSARDGGWFLWRDRKGRLRPFANRGPAVRWLAPGDDLAYPFAAEDRPWHAESSGAAGIASGALLLLLGTSPDLSLEDIDTVFTETTLPVDSTQQLADPEIADRRDLEPVAVDRDGHNSKNGYGRLNSADACLFAADPFTQALVRLGERSAAMEYSALRRSETLKHLYTDALARWAARAILRDQELSHAFCALARTFRLASRRPDRTLEQPPGHLIRQLALVVRLLLRRGVPPVFAHELEAIEVRLREVLADQHALMLELEWVNVVGDTLGWRRAPTSRPQYRSGTVVPFKEPSGASTAGGNLAG